MNNNCLLVAIGERLKARRIDLKPTQKQTADILKLSLNFYGSIERVKKKNVA